MDVPTRMSTSHEHLLAIQKAQRKFPCDVAATHISPLDSDRSLDEKQEHVSREQGRLTHWMYRTMRIWRLNPNTTDMLRILTVSARLRKLEQYIT